MPAPASACARAVLLAFTYASCVPAMSTPTPDSVPDSAPSQLPCARIHPGMNYRQVLAVMGREPDSTLSSHTVAGPSGEAPGSLTIDEWYSSDTEGYHLTTTVRYRNAVVESVECGRPLIFQPLPMPPPVLPGT